MRRVPWILLAALLGAGGVRLTVLLEPVSGLLPACAFKHLTGFACAGCGLTRCLMALGRGHWREALHWHPAAVGLAALLPLLVRWDLRRAWRGEPYPALPDSVALRASAWALLAAAWALQVVRGI